MIQFNKSQIPSLANPKFIRVALFGEEDAERTTDISNMFSNSDNEVEDTTNSLLSMASSLLASKLELEMTGPGLPGEEETSSSELIEKLSNPVPEQMTEREYLRYIKLAVFVRRAIYNETLEDGNKKLNKIVYKMIRNNTNPFSYADVSKIVREELQKEINT